MVLVDIRVSSSLASELKFSVLKLMIGHTTLVNTNSIYQTPQLVLVEYRQINCFYITRDTFYRVFICKKKKKRKKIKDFIYFFIQKRLKVFAMKIF